MKDRSPLVLFIAPWRNFREKAAARGPSPLEIVTAKMARDVDNFANKKQPSYLPAFHSFAREFISIHAARCNLGFFIAFGLCW